MGRWTSRPRRLGSGGEREALRQARAERNLRVVGDGGGPALDLPLGGALGEDGVGLFGGGAEGLAGGELTAERLGEWGVHLGEGGVAFRNAGDLILAVLLPVGTHVFDARALEAVGPLGIGAG